MKNYVEVGKQTVVSAKSKFIEEFLAGYSALREVVNGLPVLVSFERGFKYDIQHD